MTRLSDALFTTTQQRALAFLYGHPDRSFYTNEILRVTGMGVATVKRELDRMRAAGILRMARVGNQHHYQADPRCPIYAELIGIVKKTVGVTEPIRAALKLVADRIVWAFIFGSVASGKESAGSDIDLLIVGDLGFSEVANALYPLQAELGREVNPKLYMEPEWRQLRASDDAFIREIMAKPRIDVIGGENGSGQSRGDQPGAHRR